MPRGGARAGAGRKPKSEKAAAPKPKAHAPTGVKSADAPANWPFGTAAPAAQTAPDVEPAPLMPLDYMLSLVRDTSLDERTRLQAAIQAAPYCHPKKGESGKKEQLQDAARKVSKFAPAVPPKLVAAGGKKV